VVNKIEDEIEDEEDNYRIVMPGKMNPVSSREPGGSEMIGFLQLMERSRALALLLIQWVWWPSL
jgi:hypothetical protein